MILNFLILDDSTKLAIGQTLQAINNYNQEILRNFSNIVIPLTFFAMHEQKAQGWYFEVKFVNIIFI